MAEASFAWLSVTVKRGASIVVPQKIVKIGWDNVFGELLIQSKPSITVLLWFLSHLFVIIAVLKKSVLLKMTPFSSCKLSML